MGKRKTWRQKLAAPGQAAKVIPVAPEEQARWGGETLVVPVPIEVDAEMRRVPPGEVTTIPEIRRVLAERHGAAAACPLTTGIFAWIAAHASEEAAAEGVAETTPYWRTLKAGGELNPKYPGGVERQRVLLEQEGHLVVARGKRWFVVRASREDAK